MDYITYFKPHRFYTISWTIYDSRLTGRILPLRRTLVIDQREFPASENTYDQGNPDVYP